MKKEKFLFLISLVLLLIFIPVSFAGDVDNQGNDTVSLNEKDDDVLTAANEVYFNSSVENDGDGSVNNPYKYVYSYRITSNSILHFANGEYSLSSSKTVYTMTMIGEDAEKTIFKGNGDLFTVSGTLTLQNMTFLTSTFTNHGTMRATNVIFDGGVADSADEYGNSFGGTIFNDGEYYYPHTYLTNCTVKNSHAEYGGAIYMSGGSATITDSKFINNSAYNYGGAIACENVATLTLSNCIFENDFSYNDAGGAIYSVDSSLNIKDSVFINCSATFGGAICDLTSKSIINNITANSNRAKYQGGAIYKMYGEILITGSEFNSNVALSGGALFIDNTTSFSLTKSIFNSNIAYICGGAVYSLLNTKSVINTNSYNRNSAPAYSNIYETDKVSFNVDNSNYTIFKYDDSNNGTLPSRYDLRDYGWVSPVKDQETSGNCWAFSAIAALESCILKASNVTYDLSEENVKNLIEWYSDYGWKMDTNGGGYDEMAIGYLVSWMGPVLESEDEFDDYSLLSPLLKSLMHIQNIVFLGRNDYTDNDAIKEAIMKYGAVSTGIMYSSEYLNSRTKGYYYSGSAYSNHAVAIVGWDDNYSRYNFRSTPSGNGAFIVKNSWSEKWGDNGYFYVSYYDTKFAEVGDNHGSFTFILNDTLRYDKNYQYDIIGCTDYFITGKNSIWYQNLFNATGDELITAFSTYFNTTTDWEAYIYVNDNLRLTQSGTSPAGYYTIDLNEFVPVKLGDVFKISLKINASKYASFPVCEGLMQNKISYVPGISFFSYNGKTWYDLYNYSLEGYDHSYSGQVACIKAFTVIDKLSSSIILNDISREGEVQKAINISGIVVDQYGNMISEGNLTFNYGENEKTVEIKNALINTTLTFDDLGKYDVLVTFTSDYYLSSNTSFSINISKSNVVLDLVIDDIRYGDDLIVNITLTDLNGNKIYNDVILTVNGVNYTVSSNIIFTISDLIIGKYEADVYYPGESRYFNASSSTNFTILKENVDVSLTVVQNFDNVSLIINSSKDLTVQVKINDEKYNVSCVNNTGVLDLFNLDYGDYSVNISLFGNNYEDLNVSNVFSIWPIRTILQAKDINMYYKDGTRFKVNLTDINGNTLTNRNIVINIGGVNYTKTTNANASASLGLNLNSGSYNVTVYYRGNKMFSPSNITYIINILPTVVSSDITKYYRNATQFRALILDKGGNPSANKTVSFNINGVFYNRTTNNLGFAKLNINLEAGEYILTTINPITGEMASNNVKVISRLVDNNDVVKYYRNATQYLVKVVGDTGNPLVNRTVKFNINGLFYYRSTNALGFAKLNINLGVGEYIITAEYNGCRVSNSIKVLSVIESDDLSMNYRDGSTFKVRILNGQGNPFFNQSVVFNINGVFYTRFTNDEGIARLNIYLMSGEYIITSSYNNLNAANKITIH